MARNDVDAVSNVWLDLNTAKQRPLRLEQGWTVRPFSLLGEHRIREGTVISKATLDFATRLPGLQSSLWVQRFSSKLRNAHFAWVRDVQFPCGDAALNERLVAQLAMVPASAPDAAAVSIS